jgi:predicted nuclease of predicted toxin-antitoxin system
MKLLLDECLSFRLMQALVDNGLDVVHVADLELLGATDARVLDTAIEQGRTLVSADTDFGALMALTNADKPSMVVVRGFPSGERMIEAIANGAIYLEENGYGVRSHAILTVTPDHARLRTLPIFPDTQ